METLLKREVASHCAHKWHLFTPTLRIKTSSALLRTSLNLCPTFGTIFFYLQVSFRCFSQERQNHLTPTHNMMDCNTMLWDTSLLWKSFCPVCILEIKTKTEQRTFRRSCELSDLTSNFSMSYPSGFNFIIRKEREFEIMFVCKLLKLPVSHTPTVHIVFL